MRILIVEDDFISRRLLSRYLVPYGDCDVAINGEEALIAIEDSLDHSTPYDLICLDIMMPGLNGQETLEALRKLESEHTGCPDTAAKVVMTTSLEDNHSIRQAFHASADGYLLKPIKKQIFVDLLTDLGLVAAVSV